MDNEMQRRRRRAQQRRDTAKAYGVMVGFFAFLMVMAIYFMFFHNKDSEGKAAELPKVVNENKNTQEVNFPVSSPDESAGTPASAEATSSQPAQTDASAAESVSSQDAPQTPQNKVTAPVAEGHTLEVKDGVTYVDGILVVNKTYSLPRTYAPGGLAPEAEAAFNQMANDSWGEGIGLFICSGYRTYQEQEEVYNRYANERGTEEADKVSSRPGHSEHQSGLSMDINTTDYWFVGTPQQLWLEAHCADYGFIIRFPEGKESYTGFEYEPWHIRYVGVELAKKLTEQGLCLEEYLGITSDYRYATDQN
ncbi:MAG: D-alanyl-D-alanine carboxypeptidase family protein [Ruminococcus sp.]|nr:D-alanyl-D-alanine carboxypeptidase family protein [Ruminococcus sp.]